MNAYLENLKLPEEPMHKVVFLEYKDDGKGRYRKWIKNERFIISDENGNKFYALKASGSFMHEDTMAVKWINPHKTIVVLLSDWNKRSVDEVYIPNIGWKKAYDAQIIFDTQARDSLIEAA